MEVIINASSENKGDNFSKIRKLEVEITYKYEIEVDETDDIVKDYENDKELVQHLADYRFGTVLPVIQVGAVQIKDIELVEVVRFNAI